MFHDRAHRGRERNDGHNHELSADADRRWLSVALTLIVAFMVAEVVIGLLSRSLALLSDAAHMLTDAASIVLALVAIRLAARPARGHFTFGLKRAEILSAQVNGVSLLVLGAVIAYEAISRLVSPVGVHGWTMVFTAVAGVGVNIAATAAITRANRSSLNIEGAFQHILNDLYAFAATAVAGLVIVWTGFERADAIASLVVVVLMARAGYGLLRDSGRILLEAAPIGLDPDVIGDALVDTDGVVEVHDLHVWSIGSGQPALSAHVLVGLGVDCHAIRAHLDDMLGKQFGVSHTTMQVDHVGPEHGASGIKPYTAHCEDAHGPTHTIGEHDH